MTPAALSDHQVILGITLIFAVAAACQVVAPRLRLPALVLLLPAGFLLGAATDAVNPEAILGSAFGPVVDLVVAVILFQGGLDLSGRKANRQDGRTGLRMVWLGGGITWALASLLMHFVAGLPAALAILVGAIVSVSGPTVVNPLLSTVRPKARVRNILLWESTVLDPIGALVAVVIFQGIKAGSAASVQASLVTFVVGLAVAVGFALVGLLVIVVGLKVTGPKLVLGTQVMLAGVILSAGLANVVSDNAGLLTALLLGIGVAELADRLGADIDPVKPFFATIVSIAIGVLFVGLSALVTPSSLGPLLLPGIAIIAILVLAVRPLAVFASTMGRGLTGRERLFMGWMAPRGIVAAATAASVATTLVALHTRDAGDVLPLTFLVIAGTVFIYGLTAGMVARLLGVQEDDEGVGGP